MVSVSESIKVLLVEDNMGDARLLYEGMEEALPGQFKMTHVRRLSETLEYLWEDSCSVVLLDLGLPDSHGLDTLVLVRAQAPDVPIVVLTGFQDEETGDQALTEGAQDYLIKGQVDSKLLARSMRYAIARKAAEQAMLQQGIALAKADELQRSRKRLIAVHERARRSVASQLQHQVQEKLQAAAVRLEEVLTAADPGSGTTEFLREIQNVLHEVSEKEVGRLGRELYPQSLAEGVIPTLRALADQLDPAATIEISPDEELVRQEKGGHPLFPEEVGLAIYRIAEEALTNVAKHAKASRVAVRLEPLRPGWWRLTVEDNGQGFDLDGVGRGPGIGMMYDYARALNGECVIHSAPGVGTEITAALPLSSTAAEAAKTSEKGVN